LDSAITPLVGLAIAAFIILGPGAPAFDITSFLRGIALFAVINWLLLPTIADWWRALDERRR
jgi:hypothetical protein